MQQSLDAFDDAGVGVVVVTYDAPELQAAFLEGLPGGSAMLNTEAGAVRTYFPRSPTSGAVSFVNVLADAAGIDPPDEEMSILFRRGASNNARAIRAFPAHNVALLPAEWLADPRCFFRVEVVIP